MEGMNSRSMTPAPGSTPHAGTGVGIKFDIKHTFGCNHVQKSFADPVQSFAMTVGDKDYSDRLLYKVGKHLTVFNPETNEQSFFDRPKAVTDVLHFSISPNSRFVSVCEVSRNEKLNEVSSHVSVYFLVKFNRLKTLSYTLPKPFVCSTFCAEGKMVAALSDEPERHIVIWQWEREKVYKTVSVGALSVSLLRSAPSANVMLTTTGNGVLKNWCVSSDSMLKPGNFMPPAKEASENFIDHAWLPSNMGLHKMVALADADGGHDHGTVKYRKQVIYIFEGSDNTQIPGSGPSSQASVPIIVELRQALTLKLDLGSRMEKIVFGTKTFCLVGTMGLVGTYERTDDKHEPYVESRRLVLGDKQFVGGTIYPSEEKMVVITRQGRLLNMPLDVTIEQIQMSSLNDALDGAGGDDDDSLGDDGSQSALAKRAKGAHGISDINAGGYHCTTIIAADMAYERPLMVTIAADCTARVWNYRTKKCELTHHFGNDEPLAVAFHTAGFQLLVSFKDRVRMYNVLMDKLKPCRETVVKQCKVLKFSHGSQYFAAASAINVYIYETKSFVQLKQCMGHMLSVQELSWAHGDQVLFSAGADGNVYGWPIAKPGRMDIIAASNRSSPSTIIGMEIDAPSTVFKPAAREGDDDGSSVGNAGGGGSTIGFGGRGGGDDSVDGNDSLARRNNLDRHNLVLSTQDGSLRIAGWSLDSVVVKVGGASRAATAANDQVEILPGELTHAITAMQLSECRSLLYVGTSMGTLRVYRWPPENLSTMGAGGRPGGGGGAGVPSGASIAGSVSGNSTASSNMQNLLAQTTQTPPTFFYEVVAHSGPVVTIKVSTVDNIVMSAAADGSIFIHDIKEDVQPGRPGGGDGGGGGGGGAEKDVLALDGMEVSLNDDVVLMSIEDIEDHIAEVLALQKDLHETKAKNDFHMRKVESDHTETLKKMVEMHDAAINREKEQFEKHRSQFEKRFSDLVASVEAKEADNQKIRSELENKYEHKLADQLERYDTLSEKMQLLKQECQALLEKHRNDFQKELNQVRIEGHNREKKLNNEQRRAVEDKKANEDAFKEILHQQEDEYEDELKQMIEAANFELTSERETILKLRTLVQTKNTKLDQLKKKLVELSSASKARLVLLEKERAEKVKLKDTIEHYKANLREREIALEEKEKIVLELRSTTRTLENFRFVLDHRLQQLSSERGPITTHIEGLEKHISTMYEELVEEFNAKKSSQEAAQLKDQKIHWIVNDLNKLRESMRERDQYITAFKRELNNIVSSMVVGKELEESVRILYRKFVRGETGAQAVFKLGDHITGKVDDLLHGGADADDHSVLSMDSIHGKRGKTAGGQDMDSSMVKEIEEALVETAKEADRQKKFVERQTNNLRHRLHCVKRETHTVARHRLNENSNLLFECNELRTEVRELQRKLAIKANELELANRNMDVLRSEVRESIGPLSKSNSVRLRSAMGGGSSGGGLKTPGSAGGGKPTSPQTHGLASAGAPAATGGGGMGTLDIGPPRPDSSKGRWIINNSLSKGQLEIDTDSLHSLHGQPPPLGSPEDRRQAGTVTGASTGAGALVLSQSAPQLPYYMDDETAHNTAAGGGGVGAAPVSAQPDGRGGGGRAMGHSQSQAVVGVGGAGIGKHGQGIGGRHHSLPAAGMPLDATKHISLNLPRAGPSAVHGGSAVGGSGSGPGGLGLGSVGGGGPKRRATGSSQAHDYQVDKLQKEVTSLAVQLDESLREKEQQRIELTRLRKQVMTMSAIHGGGAGGGSHVSHDGYNSLHLPSLTGGNNNGKPDVIAGDSISLSQMSGGGGGGGGGHPAAGDSRPLTNADMYGQPSEQDKQNMRLAPSASMLHNGNPSSKARNSTSGKGKKAATASVPQPANMSPGGSTIEGSQLE